MSPSVACWLSGLCAGAGDNNGSVLRVRAQPPQPALFTHHIIHRAFVGHKSHGRSIRPGANPNRARRGAGPGRRDALLPFLPVASVSAVTCTLKEFLRSRARRVAAGPGGLLSLARAVTVSLSRVGPLRRRCGSMCGSRPLSVRPVCVSRFPCVTTCADFAVMQALPTVLSSN